MSKITKSATATATPSANQVTVVVNKVKETKNKIVFAEVPGTPGAPVTIDGLYLPKEIFGSAETLVVTFEM